MVKTSKMTGIKAWPEDDRPREKLLKKLLAGYEVREIERERSEGYINRVKDFLDGCDDSKEKIDFADKKQLAELFLRLALQAIRCHNFLVMTKKQLEMGNPHPPEIGCAYFPLKIYLDRNCPKV